MKPVAAPGLVVAAPASGSGKTTVTLALLRALSERGVVLGSLKVGPDYIDPAFHAAASGRECLNVDLWAMREATVQAVIAQAASGASLVIAEGVMGLFDGAADGSASTAHCAALTGWPVLLVVDASGMAGSAAALVKGFAEFREDVEVAAVVFNRVGSAAHAAMLREACAELGVPVLGALPREPDLALPDRHLGLVQAREHADLDQFVARAAVHLVRHVDLDALAALARPCAVAPLPAVSSGDLPPPGQRVAVARDQAFGFVYPYQLQAWQRAGAEVSTFSPLADEGPHALADAVFLPGGYPELHAGRLAACRGFLSGLRRAAARGARVHGECGGFMTLGHTLVDGDGVGHAMAGLLPVETSFERPKLTLGYREMEMLADGPLGPRGTRARGHEFHFASTVGETAAEPLARCTDARGEDRGTAGARVGRVTGSFVHVVDLAEGGQP